MSALPIRSLLFDRGAAEAALAAAGVDPEPGLGIDAFDLVGVGVVQRLVGVMRRVPGSGSIHSLLAPILAAPVNVGVAKALQEGRLGHVPLNRWVAGQLAERLLELRVHFPFALRPLNADIGKRLAQQEALRPVGFRGYFAQGVELRGEDFVLKRLIGLPVAGSAGGTEHDPSADEILDDRIGVLVEAFVRLPG